MSYSEDFKQLQRTIQEQGERSECRQTGYMLELIGASFSFAPYDLLYELHQGWLTDVPLNANFAHQLATNIWEGLDGQELDKTGWSPRQLSFLDLPIDHAGDICATYGPKFKAQYEAIKPEILKPSRRANIVICTPGDAQIMHSESIGHLEYPCTQSYQFLNRADNVLHMHVHMRSQNIRLMPLDNYIQMHLQTCICAELRLKAGKITVSFGSLHMLEN